MKSITPRIIFVIALIVFMPLAIVFSQKDNSFNWKNMSVLVYTKNGKGYVHDNIPYAVACVQQLGKKYGFQVIVSDTPSVFTRENLSKFRLLVFTSTNNDVFDNDTQRLAFRHYIEAGGGLVGIHSAIATERNWTWFKQLVGGTFSWHARFQKFKVIKLDKTHPSVSSLPNTWERNDECYFEKEMYPGIHTIMAHDVASLKPADEKERENIVKNIGSFGQYYPAVWHHYFDGGLCWLTTLGHNKNDYAEPVFVQHIYEGMLYVAKNVKPLNFAKAYAKNRDSAVEGRD